MSVFHSAVAACEGYIGRGLAVAALGAAAAHIGKSPDSLGRSDLEPFIQAFSESLAPITSAEVLERIAAEVRRAEG